MCIDIFVSNKTLFLADILMKKKDKGEKISKAPILFRTFTIMLSSKWGTLVIIYLMIGICLCVYEYIFRSFCDIIYTLPIIIY